MNRTLKQGVIAVVAVTVACGDAGRAFNVRPVKSERTVSYEGKTHRVVQDGGQVRHYIDGKLFSEQVGGSLVVHRGGKALRFAVPVRSERVPVFKLGALLTPKEAFAAAGPQCVRELFKLAAAAAVLIIAIDAAVAAEIATLGGATPAVIVAVAGAITVYTGAVYEYAACTRENP